MFNRLLRFCQRGVIQFILTQPTVAFVSLMLLAAGKYQAPEWQIVQTIIYNISYAWALYCLYVCYLAIHQNIKNFRPIAISTAPMNRPGTMPPRKRKPMEVFETSA